MHYITEWVTNIILFILLAIVIDLLLPNSNLQRYTKMVVGLLLIVIILSPVLKIFNKDVDNILQTLELSSKYEGENTEILIENKKREIQASQRAYILEQMAVQMENQVEEELVTKHGYQVQDLKLSIVSEENDSLSMKDIKSVNLILSENEEREVSHIVEVEEVMIDTTEPLNKTENEPSFHHIQSYLSNEWEIPSERINIALEGGEMK